MVISAVLNGIALELKRYSEKVGKNKNVIVSLLKRIIDTCASHRKVVERCEKSIKDLTSKDLDKEREKKTSSRIKKIRKEIKGIASSALPQPVKPAETQRSDGIANLGVTCWMNTLLQHLRFTRDFETILTGEIRNCANDAVHARFVHFQERLRFVVGLLRRDPNLVTQNMLRDIARLFREIGLINNEHAQHDATEVLTRLAHYMGRAPRGLEINEQFVYADRVIENHVGRETSHILALQTHRRNETTSEMLANYFGEHQVDIVNFVTGAGRFPNTHFRPEALTRLPINASENEIRQYQVNRMQESLNDGDSVRVVALHHYQRKIASLPPMIQLNINRLGGNPVVEDLINIAAFRSEDLTSTLSRYSLDAVMCRRGANTSTSGGHFWYYKKIDNRWVRYDDISVSYPNPETVQREFNTAAYACFYNRINVE